ncbi:MAG: ABC transporter ATP-binding protein, partial [Gammaproteobacteria bacterium]|nr:ABC transporter ATP-binding protein [Gammaproteobacteria bacterium]
MPKNPLLSVKNLSIETKKKKLVKNISFEINKGQIFALVGESGSGKSLTALSILDLLSKGLTQTGNFIFNGKTYDQTELFSLRGSEVAFIFQDPSNSLNPVMTIGEQIDEVIKANTSLSKSERLQKIRDSFNKVEMDSSDEMLNRYPHQISGGQKQRVLIAFALAADAKLIIADEPTTALDVTTQKTILNLLKDLQKTQKLSILLITHDLSVVKMMSDKVGVMYQGEIIEQQSSKAFFNKP